MIRLLPGLVVEDEEGRRHRITAWMTTEEGAVDLVLEPAGTSEREQRLVGGFVWLLNVHHEILHKEMITQGKRTFKECDARTCKYGASVVVWAEST